MIADTPISQNAPFVLNSKKSKSIIQLFALTNAVGTKAIIANYGHFLESLFVYDKSRNLINVIENIKDTLEANWMAIPPFMFTSDSEYEGNMIGENEDEERLSSVNFSNTIYFDFERCFSNLVWEVTQPRENVIELSYLLRKMDKGLPANLKMKIIYSLSNDNSLKIVLEALTDKNMIFSFNKHAFFNLNGCNTTNIQGHLLQINANSYFPVDCNLLPVFDHESSIGTPFDFNKATVIGARINDNNEQLKNANGYHHSFLLNKHSSKTPVAKVMGDKSGIVLEVCTDAPVLHFYSGNAMPFAANHNVAEKDNYRNAFSIVPQIFNSLNQRVQFPTMVLKANQPYKLSTTYRFSVNG